MEGKESQKDILRLRQLEQAKQESNATAAAETTSTVAESSNTSGKLQSTSTFNETAVRPANGYPLETPSMSENQ